MSEERPNVTFIQAREDPIDWSSRWRPVASRGEDWNVKPPDTGNLPLPDAQMHLMKSDIMDNLKFFGYIGAGAHGVVYKATAYLRLRVPDRILYEPAWKKMSLACKVIRQPRMDNKYIENSLAEMKSLRYLRHENICNLIEVISIPDMKSGFPYSMVCYFFELCDGNLLDLVKEYALIKPPEHKGGWNFPDNLCRHWFAQIARALEYIHTNGVFHRDIAMRNILYRFGDHSSETFEDRFLSSIFKLADFGMSYDPITTSQMSEFRRMTVPIDDIKELGQVLYITGEQSFVGFMKSPVSQSMRNLMNRMYKGSITPTQILQHEWLQSNEEPRTRPYIVSGEVQHEPFRLLYDY